MSDPDTTRPFSPAELDAIEDALEQLHGNDAFVVNGVPADADVAVRERLASYRAISRLSRDVLHAYEAPRHVLDRVVSIARESAVATTTPMPEAAPARPSWWTRIRGAWTVPIVATLAAAALVVIIAVPMTARDAATAGEGVARNENAPASPPVSTVASSAAKESDAAGTVSAPAVEGRLAMAEPTPEEEESTATLRGGAALDELSKEQRDLRQDAARVDDDTRTGDGEELQRGRKSATKTERADASGTSAGPAKPSSKPKTTTTDLPASPKAPPSAGKPGGGGASPKPTEPAEKKDADKGSDALTKADALRRGGDCGSAVKLYESVRKTGTKSQRARALAGLALCAEREGDRVRADDLLAKARADDADIDAYYESQR